MFIRKCIKTDKVTGKKYFFYQLVEAVRTERGPRQATLLNLGADLEIAPEETKLLANRIEEIVKGIQSLVPSASHIELLARRFANELIKKQSEVFQYETTHEAESEKQCDYHTVDINTLKQEHCRTVGVETVAYAAFKELSLEEKFQELGFSCRQIEVAAAVIIGRLAGPGNELATHHWLKNESGLDEVMETTFQNLALRKVYEIGDLLLSKKDKIEQFLEVKENTLFNIQDRVLLYDLTNTYFEGSAKGHIGAHRGKSKENRADCPLITLGVVLNQEGFVKCSRIFNGNISEPKTLNTIIQDVIEQKSAIKPIIVIDAGLSTEDNLQLLRDDKLPYIAVSRKKAHLALQDLEEVVKDEDDNVIRVKLVKNQETEEIELHCHSAGRQKKEQAIQTTFQQRFETKLKKIADGIKKPKGRKKYTKVLHSIGRLCEKYQVISSYYSITVHPDNKSEYAIAIDWQFKEEKAQVRFDGCYVLRSYGVNLTAKELWKTYVLLTEVEDSFRSMKTDLSLRPIFHKKEHRIDAHLFITVLAYHVMHTIRFKLRQHGIRFSWGTVRKNMRTLTRTTTVMKTEDKKQLHVRVSTEPEPFHKKILNALKITSLPKPKKTII
jgi:transposase